MVLAKSIPGIHEWHGVEATSLLSQVGGEGSWLHQLLDQTSKGKHSRSKCEECETQGGEDTAVFTRVFVGLREQTDDSRHADTHPQLRHTVSVSSDFSQLKDSCLQWLHPIRPWHWVTQGYNSLVGRCSVQWWISVNPAHSTCTPCAKKSESLHLV